MQNKFLLLIFIFSTGFQSPVFKEASLRSIVVKKGIDFANKFDDGPLPAPSEKEFKVDLKNPTFKEGTITTKDGGVIQNADIRIQAEKIKYTKRKNEHFIEAESYLLIQYKGRAYIGKKFEYNFLTKSGTVYIGKTFVAPFYIGGDEIFLDSDGNYKVKNAFLTTCENQDSLWEIHAEKLKVTDKELLQAKSVSFRYFNIPFWLPSFRINLKKFFQPITRYKLTWDKGAGPRASLRYQIYSWKEFALYLRGEYRLRKGFGGALETEYYPEHKRSYLLTKSYLATDVLPTDPVNKRRYRLQGEGKSTSPSGKTKMEISWDKYSDILMPGDFKSEDFELNTAKKSEFYLHHKEKDMLASVLVRPRLNSFQSIKQQLPTGYTTMKSYKFPHIGLICDNWTKASYLKLSYSDDLSVNLTDFDAARLETQIDAYRPFHWKAVTFTPRIGVIGIYYSNNPQNHQNTFALIKYGGKMETNFYRCYQKHKHIVQPYLEYTGYSKPTSFISNHFIFSIQDGYNKINQLTFGLRNLFLLSNENRLPFVFDLYAHAFFANDTFSQSIPRIYLMMEWSLPHVIFKIWGAYNNRHHEIDYSNLRALWTINDNAAFTFEFRYRSKYHYRKADQNNFILDVTREEDEILLSPLSDRRITILSHLFLRLSPFWTMHLRSHLGFFRKGEPPYNELRCDFYKLLTCNWRMRITYQHTQRDDRVSVGFDLLKN